MLLPKPSAMQGEAKLDCIWMGRTCCDSCEMTASCMRAEELLNLSPHRKEQGCATDVSRGDHHGTGDFVPSCLAATHARKTDDQQT